MKAERPWPLVGRAEELAHVRGAILDHGVSVVCIAGGAGVGKTRLAREAPALAGEAGLVVEWVAATQSSAGSPLPDAIAALIARGSVVYLELQALASGEVHDVPLSIPTLLSLADAKLAGL